MVVDRATGRIRHEMFANVTNFLPASALMVMNNTRVLPARLVLRRTSGGRLQGLFLREATSGVWELMVTSGRRLKPGELLLMEGGASRAGASRTGASDLSSSSDRSQQQLRMIEHISEGTWLVEPVPAGVTTEILATYGSAPLPPYIRREPMAVDQTVQHADVDDLDRYQTVYATQPGAIAAPTAGLHFTPELLAKIDVMCVGRANVTLHVGAGTFAPIRVDDLAEHRMHSEWYECSAATAQAVNSAKISAQSIVAVGTTSVRVLETCADESGRVTPGSGWTNIFIYPPYRYRVVDALLTNFHLPGSTLLALIFAMAGRELILQAYHEAVRERYRFFSYGDAMLIL